MPESPGEEKLLFLNINPISELSGNQTGVETCPFINRVKQSMGSETEQAPIRQVFMGRTPVGHDPTAGWKRGFYRGLACLS